MAALLTQPKPKQATLKRVWLNVVGDFLGTASAIDISKPLPILMLVPVEEHPAAADAGNPLSVGSRQRWHVATLQHALWALPCCIAPRHTTN